MQLLIFSLSYICMLRGALRERKIEKERGVQEHAGCCVCIFLEEEYSHALHPKVHECINAKLLFCVQGTSVGCSLLALLLLIKI